MPKKTKKATVRKAPVKNLNIGRPGFNKARSLSASKAAMPASSKSSSNRFSIFIYWFIIVFFICATFYILGRSQEILKYRHADNVELVEEPLTGKTDLAAEYLDSGQDKLLSGDPTAAIYDLSIAIEAAPTTFAAYVFRGEAYMQNADYVNAMADINRALELNPESAVAYYDRMLLNIKLENYPAAVADANRALAEYQKAPDGILSMHSIYSKRAQLNLWTKNWTAAVADYSSAIAQEPDNYDDYAGRAEAKTAAADYEGARDDYMAAVRLISEQIQTQSSKEEREKMSREAIAYFEKVGALQIRMNDAAGAASSLESAHTIAVALGDADQATRLRTLIMSLN